MFMPPGATKARPGVAIPGRTGGASLSTFSSSRLLASSTARYYRAPS